MQAAQEQHSKELRLNRRHAAQWACGQSQTCTRSALGPQKRLSNVVQPGKQNLCSVREAASCCQPRRAPSSHSSVGGTQGAHHWPRLSRRVGSSPTHLPETGLQMLRHANMVWWDCPSNCRSRRSATTGWRLKIMGMQSAQLAQCAGTRDQPALRRPNPPNTKAKDAVSLTEAAWLGSICNRLQTHQQC